MTLKWAGSNWNNIYKLFRKIILIRYYLEIFYYNVEKGKIESLSKDFRINCSSGKIDPESIGRNIRLRIGNTVRVNDQDYEILDFSITNFWRQRSLTKNLDDPFYLAKALVLDKFTPKYVHIFFRSSPDIKEAKVDAYYNFKDGIYFNGQYYDLISDLEISRVDLGMNQWEQVDLEEKSEFEESSFLPLDLESKKYGREYGVPSNTNASQLIRGTTLDLWEMEERIRVRR